MPEKSHSNWYRKGGISDADGTNLTSGITIGGRSILVGLKEASDVTQVQKSLSGSAWLLCASTIRLKYTMLSYYLILLVDLLVLSENECR
jgi:hypothetical protein